MNLALDDGLRAALIQALRTPALPVEAPEPLAPAQESATEAAPAAAADPGETLLALDVWSGTERVLSAAVAAPEAAGDAATNAQRLTDYVMQALG